MAGVVGHHAALPRAGDLALVRYACPGPEEWHARVLLSHIELDSWVILTPDYDVYVERMSSGNAELSGFRFWSGGALPPGVPSHCVYDFNPRLSADDLRPWIADAEGFAAAERLRRGVSTPAVLPVSPPEAGGQRHLRSAPVPLAAAHARGATTPAAGAGSAPPPPGGLGAAATGGIAALTAALGGASYDEVPSTQPGLSSDGDARTLAVRFDEQNVRHVEFGLALERMHEDQWADWPIRGPRTTKWVCVHIYENARTPLNHHAQWRANARLQAQEPGVSEHEQACRTLQVLACFDQLNLYNLAGAEVVARRLQMVEEKYKDRILSSMGEAEPSEQHLFSGTQGTRANLCICPALQSWIAEEMGKESAILKERRKAREERQLARPKQNAKGGRQAPPAEHGQAS